MSKDTGSSSDAPVDTDTRITQRTHNATTSTSWQLVAASFSLSGVHVWGEGNLGRRGRRRRKTQTGEGRWHGVSTLQHEMLHWSRMYPWHQHISLSLFINAACFPIGWAGFVLCSARWWSHQHHQHRPHRLIYSQPRRMWWPRLFGEINGTFQVWVFTKTHTRKIVDGSRRQKPIQLLLTLISLLMS